jgi:hypothetical protein
VSAWAPRVQGKGLELPLNCVSKREGELGGGGIHGGAAASSGVEQAGAREEEASGIL